MSGLEIATNAATKATNIFGCATKKFMYYKSQSHGEFALKMKEDFFPTPTQTFSIL